MFAPIEEKHHTELVVGILKPAGGEVRESKTTRLRSRSCAGMEFCIARHMSFFSVKQELDNFLEKS